MSMPSTCISRRPASSSPPARRASITSAYGRRTCFEHPKLNDSFESPNPKDSGHCRTTAIGAQQAFSISATRVSNAPIPVTRKAEIEPPASTLTTGSARGGVGFAAVGARGSPRVTTAPHKGEGDDAERGGEHHIEARRQAVAGQGDQPGRDQRGKAAEDRHRAGEAQ
jgi:hypothetical protein